MHATRTRTRTRRSVRPSWGWFALLDGGIVALAILAFSPDAHARVSERVPAPLPSPRVCRQMLVGTAAIHLAEAGAAGRMARRRGISPRGWRLQTFVVGFPSLLALRTAAAPRAGAPAGAA